MENFQMAISFYCIDVHIKSFLFFYRFWFYHKSSKADYYLTFRLNLILNLLIFLMILWSQLFACYILESCFLLEVMKYYFSFCFFNRLLPKLTVKYYLSISPKIIFGQAYFLNKQFDVSLNFMFRIKAVIQILFWKSFLPLFWRFLGIIFLVFSFLCIYIYIVYKK